MYRCKIGFLRGLFVPVVCFLCITQCVSCGRNLQQEATIAKLEGAIKARDEELKKKEDDLKTVEKNLEEEIEKRRKDMKIFNYIKTWSNKDVLDHVVNVTKPDGNLGAFVSSLQVAVTMLGKGSLGVLGKNFVESVNI